MGKIIHYRKERISRYYSVGQTLINDCQFHASSDLQSISKIMVKALI